MPSRLVPFVEGEYYHVFNRGVNKRKIFLDSKDHQRAIDTIQYYLYSGHSQRFSYYSKLSELSKQNYLENLSGQLVTVVAYVLMPNHFHFLLTQVEENGISNFMSLFQNSYTKYFNTKHKRTGHLLQGQFKSVHIEDDEQLLHVSRYIHLNPLSSKLVQNTDELEKYSWSSYPRYLKANLADGFIQNDIILSQFKNQSYQVFVNEQSLYQQELETIKHLTLE